MFEIGRIDKHTYACSLWLDSYIHIPIQETRELSILTASNAMTPLPSIVCQRHNRNVTFVPYVALSPLHTINANSFNGCGSEAHAAWKTTRSEAT